MVLKIPKYKSLLRTQSEEIARRPLFTLGKTNRNITTITEGWAVSGNVTLQAYGLGNAELDMGFQVTYFLKNESGASRNVTWSIDNITKSTTLKSGVVDLGDGNISTVTFFFSIEKVQSSDFLRFTWGNEGVGTANPSSTCAQISFDVTSVFLSEDDTE